MDQLSDELRRMLNSAGIVPQMIEARRLLATVLSEQAGETAEHALGLAYRICDAWQSRLEWALQTEVPDWIGLAAFRSITDFSIPSDDFTRLFPPHPQQGIQEVRDAVRNAKSSIDSPQACWAAHELYFQDKEDFRSGKLPLGGEMVDHFLQRLEDCDPLLGGQAGNILWLWRAIGAEPIAYVPYVAKQLVRLGNKLPATLANLQVLQFESGGERLTRLADTEGGIPRSDGSRASAPSGGSVVLCQAGRRLILAFPGVRDLDMKTSDPMPWDSVQFFDGSQPICAPIERDPTLGITWPSFGLFCECHIEASDRRLVVRLIDDERLERALRGRVDLAVIGGIDVIFFDKWFEKDPRLKARLRRAAERQLRALARCRIRIGAELSGVPVPEFAHLLQRLCRDDVIVALGINGVDELPDVVGQRSLENKLYDFWLDPETLHPELCAEDQG